MRQKEIFGCAFADDWKAVSAPKPLRSLVAEFLEHRPEHDGFERAADKLEAALDAWDAFLASKGEHNDSLREQLIGPKAR